MGSFGDRLRREREQRGVSLDDIALTTKIRAGLLQALEEERFDRLPGGIFNKGFVRAYARHLGLDEDQAVADYLAASGEAPVRRPGESQAGMRGETTEPRIQLVGDEQESDAKTGTPLSSRAVLAGLLVLVVVGAVAWFYYHREKRPEIQSSSEPAAVTAPANPAPAPPSASGESAPSATAPSAPAAPSQQSASREAVPPVGTNPVASTSTNPAPSGVFTVDLKAEEDCWAQITTDGKTQEITLDAGLQKVITAKNRVTIRAGSVGALAISFNGRRLPSQGDYGQVKTLIFGPDGLEPPTPKPISPPPATP
jgi:cytoskeleton protein RodZ